MNLTKFNAVFVCLCFYFVNVSVKVFFLKESALFSACKLFSFVEAVKPEIKRVKSRVGNRLHTGFNAYHFKRTARLNTEFHNKLPHKI
jgi:hypothetical protein